MLCKAILIDSAKRELREVNYEPGTRTDHPRSLQALIGGYLEAAGRWSNGDVLYVDDMGLMKPQQHFFRIRSRSDGQPLGGNGVLVGREMEVPTNPNRFYTLQPGHTVEALAHEIQFLSREEAEAWGKANASEPAFKITIVTEDGAGETTVLDRFGAVFSRIPKA